MIGMRLNNSQKILGAQQRNEQQTLGLLLSCLGLNIQDDQYL